MHGWLGGGDFDEDWYRFSTVFGTFLVPFVLISATFSVPGHPWQTLGATLGSQRGKSNKKPLVWPALGVPFGSLWVDVFDINEDSTR